MKINFVRRCVVLFIIIAIANLTSFSLFADDLGEGGTDQERMVQISILSSYFIKSEQYIDIVINTIPGAIILLIAESNNSTPLPEDFFAVLKNNEQDESKILEVQFLYYSTTQYYALLPIPSNLDRGDYIIETRYTQESLSKIRNNKIPQMVSTRIHVEPRVFVEEYVALNHQLAARKVKPADPQVIDEAQEIWNLTGTISTDSLYALDNFILPLETYKYVTSMYAERRVYTYMDGEQINGTIHGGIDIAAYRGTPVFATAAGKVVLAKRRIITGNSVVIMHFPGVYSLYYHLKDISVSLGDVIAMGTRLGEVGSTGFSTGPHLHWEMRVNNIRVDPILFFDRLDKVQTLRIRYR